MNRNVVIGIVAVVVVLALAAGGYKLYNHNKRLAAEQQAAMQSTAPTMSMAPEASPASDSGTMVGNVKQFTVTGSSYKFDPATMTVNKGDKVQITFKNSGGMHDFVIDELSVKTKVISSGAQEVITFTADKAGSFEYYCSVGNHRAMGMKGTLIVK